MVHKKLSLVFSLFVVLCLEFTTSFVPLGPVADSHSSTATTLTSSSDDNDVQEPPSRRRDFFRWFRRAALLTAGGGGLSPGVANADDSSTITPGGRIVDLEVSNLQGNSELSGTVRIQLEPSWAPRGVERFEDLTSRGFWNDCRIFRVLPGFVAQFGIQGNRAVQAAWRGKTIQDDPVRVSNQRGTVVFATAGPNSRTTQLFINTADNSFLDRQGFAPIGRVIEGLEYVDEFYAGYGEGAPSGQGPDQGLIQLRGNSYLKDSFPKLSYISSGTFAE